MTFRCTTARAFAPLPSALLRPALTQADIADRFVESNTDFENLLRHYAYVAKTRSWLVCERYAPDWEASTWSDADEIDQKPHVFKRIVEIIRTLVEYAPPAEQQRVLSHAFISGVVRLLQCDPRVVVEPWEATGTRPPRLIRQRRDAENDARRHAEITKENRQWPLR